MEARIGNVDTLKDGRRAAIIDIVEETNANGEKVERALLVYDFTQKDKLWDVDKKKQLTCHMGNPGRETSIWKLGRQLNKPFIEAYNNYPLPLPNLKNKTVLFLSYGPSFHTPQAQKFIKQAHRRGVVIFALSHIKEDLPHPHYVCCIDAMGSQNMLVPDHSKDIGVFGYYACPPLVSKPYKKRYMCNFPCTGVVEHTKNYEKYPNLIKLVTSFTVTLPMLHFIYQCGAKKIWLLGFDHMFKVGNKKRAFKSGTVTYAVRSKKGKILGWTNSMFVTVARALNHEAAFLYNGKPRVRLSDLGKSELLNIPKLTFKKALQQLHN